MAISKVKNLGTDKLFLVDGNGAKQGELYIDGQILKLKLANNAVFDLNVAAGFTTLNDPVITGDAFSLDAQNNQNYIINFTQVQTAEYKVLTINLNVTAGVPSTGTLIINYPTTFKYATWKITGAKYINGAYGLGMGITTDIITYIYDGNFIHVTNGNSFIQRTF